MSKSIAEEISELKHELAISKENEQLLLKSYEELEKEYKELEQDYKKLRYELNRNNNARWLY